MMGSMGIALKWCDPPTVPIPTGFARRTPLGHNGLHWVVLRCGGALLLVVLRAVL